MVLKILGCLKKHPKRGIVMDYGEPNGIANYQVLKPDFGYEHSDLEEEIDDQFPESLMDKIQSNIFIDSNHRYNKVVGKSITSSLGFIGRIPIA